MRASSGSWGVFVLIAGAAGTGCGSKSLTAPAPDAGSPIDVGRPIDTGSPIDTGRPIDTGNPTFECAVATARAAPFPTTVRFSNDGAAPLYLRQDCGSLVYGISSCSGGYRDALGPAYHCACSCADASCQGSIICGPCPVPSGLLIAPGGKLDVPWSALRVTELERGDDQRGFYSCLQTEPLPAAPYRLAVNVYGSGADAAAETGAHLFTVDFALPTADDTVVVPIGGAQAQEDRCDLDPAAAAPACAAAASRDVACSLAGAVKWYSLGGEASFYSDTPELAAPARYTRTRTFYTLDGSAPPTITSCSAAVPRCSRDARVVTTSDVAAALEHPDVTAALRQPGQLVYGEDTRGGGSILIVEQGGGSFGIGGQCEPGAPGSHCERRLPDGMAALVRVLIALDEQEMKAPDCNALPTQRP